MLSSAQLKVVFDEFDKDKSGVLDLEEVVKMVRTLKVEIEKREVENQFKAIDTNHNGKISFDEFLAWYRVGRHTSLATALKYQLNLHKVAQIFRKSNANAAGKEEKEGKRLKLLSVEMEDGKAEESFVQAVVQTGEGNSTFKELLRANPALSDIKTGVFFLTIKSTNAPELSKSFTAALETIFSMLIEMGVIEETSTFQKVVHVQAAEDELTVLIDVMQFTPFESDGKSYLDFVDFLHLNQLAGSLTLASHMSLKTIVSTVSSSLLVGESNPRLH